VKKLTLMLALLPALAGAETLAQGERDRAMSHLHATRKMFLDSVAGVSQAQWSFKPAPQVWSIAEVAEHIAVSEESLLALVTRKIMAGPAEPEKKPEAAGRDERLLKALVDRSQKAQAPEFLRPTNRWKTPQELIEQFKKSRDNTIAYVRTTQEDLRSRFAPHPVFQTLDAYQWILLISGHSERHILQLNEVKQAAGYPQK
jgi:uncharacterized damage-inducible protein DinB